MSDAAVNDDADVDVDDDDFEPEKKKLSGKKIVIFFLLPVILLGGAAVGIIMSGSLGEEKVAKQETKNKTDNPAIMDSIFFDLPEMLVNLNTVGRRPAYLKMQVSLEIDNTVDVTVLRALTPRIVDNFQIYLRELRIDDLRGSAGLYRLREELLARINITVQPIKVKDVLFKDILVQ